MLISHLPSGFKLSYTNKKNTYLVVLPFTRVARHAVSLLLKIANDRIFFIGYLVYSGSVDNVYNLTLTSSYRRSGH